MKIAIVTYALEVGGVEIFIKKLAKYLMQNGNEVTIIETHKKGRWSDAFSEEGFHVVQLLSKPLRSSIYHAKRIGTFLRDFDAVILNDAPVAQSALGLLSEKSIAIPVLHMHLTSMLENATSNLLNWDKLVAVSPYGMWAAVEYGVPLEKVQCIPNGVNVPDSWLKSEHDLDSLRQLRIVYIGRIENEQKGVLLLPEIICETLKKLNSINLEIVGDGPDLPILKHEIKAKGLNSYVNFHGSMPNDKTLEILKDADILIMPSRYEGLPIVLLEAMSFGMVPLVTKLRGRTDFVLSHGENGFLIDVDDVAGFAHYLVLLAGDRSLLKKCSFAAWQTAFERFRIDLTGYSYLALIHELKAEREKGNCSERTGAIDRSLLGDFPTLPTLFIRPFRKALRMLGLFKGPVRRPKFYDVPVGNTK